MGLFTPNKYPIVLNDEQRQRFRDIIDNGRHAAKKIKHSHILLLSDEGRPGGPLPDPAIAGRLDMHVNTVARIRKRFVLAGEQPALERKPRLTPPVPPKVDGRIEAHLIATCCSAPPDGHATWTLTLLVDHLKRNGFVTSICRETVRQALSKNELQPWRKQSWCIPDKDRARFVAQMEEVLDVYCAAGYDEKHPLICMDEASKQLLDHGQPSLPPGPGQPAREDYHYERNGVQALFMFFDPVRGYRRVSTRESRTRLDWAEEIRRLLTEDYPEAEKVTLVCDNLNTHHIASLYQAFPAAEAHALARRLDIRHTPKNGSWLNMAEIELSVLSRQCLNRRIGTAEELSRQIAAWQAERNASAARVHWRFTTADARIKLAHLYPQF